jgi:cytochrome P450
MSFYLFNFWIGGPYEARAVEAAARLRAHVRAAIDARLAATSEVPDDVLQRVIDQAQSERAPGGAAPLSDEDRDAIASQLLGLLSGSIVATIGTFLNALGVLLELPAARRAELSLACGDDAPPERLDRLVTEACRLGGAYPPMLYRVASEEVALAPGAPDPRVVPRGAWVVSVPWLANFDARRFPQPWRFRPERFEGALPCPPPLLFGSGVHRCLAEHLGHALVREMIRALFRRPGLRRAPGPEGRLSRGPKGVIPDGDFPRRLMLRW